MWQFPKFTSCNFDKILVMPFFSIFRHETLWLLILITFLSDFVTRQVLNFYLPGSFASGDGFIKKTKSGPSFTFLFSMNSLKLLNLFQNSNIMMYCYIFCNVLVLQSFKIEQQRPKILLFQIKNNYQNRDMTLPTYGTKSNQHYVPNDNAYHLKTGTNANFKFLTIY